MTLLERARRLLGTATFGLTLLQLAVFVVAAGAIVSVLFYQFNAELTRQVVATLQAEAGGFVDLNRTAGARALQEAVARRGSSGAPGLYIMVGHGDQKLAGNLNRWPPELAASGSGGLFHYTAVSVDGTSERLAIGLPVAIGDNGRLLVGRDIEDQRAMAEKAKRLLLWGLALMTAAGFAAGLLMSRVVLGRIEAVTRTVETIMSGNLSNRVVRTGSGDELDHLAVRLNAMLDRIEQLMTGMREISDNIAHDLKTPVTRLRNRAEAALLDPRGSAAHREAIEHTIEAADDLIKTFNSLLLIARLEADALEASVERFDLAALLRDVIELYEPVAEEAAMTIKAEIGTTPSICANRQLIGQAAANLLDNAIKYGVPPVGTAGEIHVALRTDGSAVVLEVADRGPGIPAEARERVLGRFVRLEESRTRPGTGLGLSLVAAVARLHGGTIELEDNAPGLKVRLRLPLEAQNGKVAGG